MNAASERRFTVTTHDRLFAFCLFLLFSYTLMSLQFQPMPLLKRRLPFDGSDYIFELKYDGFRALAVIEHGRAQLLSRNGHPFASFSALAESISTACQM